MTTANLRIASNDSAAAAGLLAELWEISEEAGTLREMTKERKKALCGLFETLAKAPGLLRDEAKKVIDTIEGETKTALIKADKLANANDFKLPGAWRQYKSDALKALGLTTTVAADGKNTTTRDDVRAGWNTWSDIKDYVNGNASGPAATCAALRELVTTIRDATKGDKMKTKRATVMAGYDAMLLRVLKDATAYINKELGTAIAEPTAGTDAESNEADAVGAVEALLTFADSVPEDAIIEGADLVEAPAAEDEAKPARRRRSGRRTA